MPVLHRKYMHNLGNFKIFPNKFINKTLRAMNFVTFLEVNGLKQKDLAQYLGISEPSVSSYVTGKSSPSAANLKKILENPAWDTSALAEDVGLKEDQIELVRLRQIVKTLTEQVKRLEEQNTKYWELIEKLTMK